MADGVDLDFYFRICFTFNNAEFMRVIKFRHYFPSTGVVTAGHDLMTLILTATGKEDFWKEAVWMQYVGLKDKNGKDIYESDVIMIDGNKKTLVSWSEKFASFCIKNDTWAFQHWFGEALDPSECEVIGNIYENPNLLK